MLVHTTVCGPPLPLIARPDLPERLAGVLQREAAAVVARRRHDDERQVGLTNRLLVAVRRVQTVAIRVDQLLEPRLLNRRPACAQRIDRSPVDVNRPHLVPAAGDGGGHARPELSQADDGDPARHFRIPIRSQLGSIHIRRSSDSVELVEVRHDHLMHVARALALAHHFLPRTEVVPHDDASRSHQTQRIPGVAFDDSSGVPAIDERRVEKPVGIGSRVPCAAVGVDLADAFAPARLQVVDANHPVRIGAHAHVLRRSLALAPAARRVPLWPRAFTVGPTASGPRFALEQVEGPDGGVALLDAPQHAVAEPGSEFEVPHRTHAAEDVPQDMTVGHHLPFSEGRAPPGRRQHHRVVESECPMQLACRQGFDGNHRAGASCPAGTQLTVAGCTTKQPTGSTLPLDVTWSWIPPASK